MIPYSCASLYMERFYGEKIAKVVFVNLLTNDNFEFLVRVEFKSFLGKGGKEVGSFCGFFLLN